MERDSSPGPTAEEARVRVSCQALYPVVRLVCAEQRPARCLLGPAYTQLGSGDFFSSASSCGAVCGAEEIHSPKSSSALPSSRACCAGRGGWFWKVLYYLGDVGNCSAPILPQEHRPALITKPCPGFVTDQDLDVTHNSRCQRKCLRNLCSVLSPEKVRPHGLLCHAFSSGRCPSAREPGPVPSPPAKQGPV